MEPCRRCGFTIIANKASTTTRISLLRNLVRHNGHLGVYCRVDRLRRSRSSRTDAVPLTCCRLQTLGTFDRTLQAGARFNPTLGCSTNRRR